MGSIHLRIDYDNVTDNYKRKTSDLVKNDGWVLLTQFIKEEDTVITMKVYHLFRNNIRGIFLIFYAFTTST
ncbi:hypothetical protein COM22_11965 [Bacillus wiedmannii]|nr:hypothetical protein COL51_14105 [Bacillus wiedmannii]PGC57411.1 hypothetical protein COM22_11965 [Bacillus wiedmannii]